MQVRWIVAALGLWLMAAPLQTQAQTPSSTGTEGAREKFLRGQRAYQQGDYERAIAEWRAAYELDARPLILYNLSQAFERSGQLPEAVEALEQYMQVAEPHDPNQDVARARLSTLRERLARTSIQIVDAPEGAKIQVDGKGWGRAPRPDPIPVEPGDHAVVVSLEGHEAFRATVGVPAGKKVEVRPELEPIAPAEDDPGGGIGPYLLGGAGAALLVGAAITGGLALSKAKGADTRDGGDADRARALGRTTDVFGALGGAALAGGILWWIIQRRRGRDAEQEPAAVSLTPVFSPGGAGAGATVRF